MIMLSKDAKDRMEQLQEEFEKKYIYCGYFLHPAVERDLLDHTQLPLHQDEGLHATCWYKTTKLTAEQFADMVARDPYQDLHPFRYVCDGKNEGIKIARPEGYYGAENPHLTLSWNYGSRPVATGTLAASRGMNLPDFIPSELPAVLQGVTYDKKRESLEYFRKEAEKIMDSCSKYVVSEVRQVDGGFGDPVRTLVPIGTFDTKSAAEDFVNKYSNPYVYEKSSMGPTYDFHRGGLVICQVPDMEKIITPDLSKEAVREMFGIEPQPEMSLDEIIGGAQANDAPYNDTPYGNEEPVIENPYEDLYP